MLTSDSARRNSVLALGAGAVALLVLALVTSGLIRFWAVLAFVASVVLLVVTVGTLVAVRSFGSGRRLFGAVVLASVAVACASVVYALVAAQAESVESAEIVRNLVAVAAFITVALAVSYAHHRSA